MREIKLLAIDVDGTLLGPDHQIKDGVVDAIYDATAAGLRVCLATGRSYVETKPVWDQLRFPPSVRPEPMIVIGGALVAEAETGRTLYQKPIPHKVAAASAEWLTSKGRSAMGIVDKWRWGFDYVFQPAGDGADAFKSWFDQMPDAKIREVQSFNHDNPADVLRVNTVVTPDEAKALETEMIERFGEDMNIHAILAPNYGITIVEAFAATANKWTALKYVAQAYRIGPGAIAAAGDDVNDLPMIEGAGLGIAMPKAPDSVKNVADMIAEDGLAQAIRNIIPR